jgi:hypothetical protein
MSRCDAKNALPSKGSFIRSSEMSRLSGNMMIRTLNSMI